MQHIRLLTLFAILLLGAIVVAAPGAPHLAQAQEANVEPNRDTPGSTFYFFADGFLENERVGYWVNAPDETIYTGDNNNLVTASSEGRADWDWTAPDDAMPGTWVMVAQGINGGHEVAIPFEIIAVSDPAEPAQPGNPTPGTEPAPTEPVDTPPTANMSPPEAVGGTRFEFYSYGFDDGERVGYWLHAPDGSIVSNNETYFVLANDDGRAAWEWESPQDAMPGVWLMVAGGPNSGYEVTFVFTILPSSAAPAESPTTEPFPEPIPTEPPQQDIPSAGPIDTTVDANMIPMEGSAGTTFDFYSFGFDAKERVGFWLNAPDGSIESDDKAYVTTANGEGRADWSWSAPEDAMPGLWTLVARGVDSEYEQVFIIPITNQ